VTTEPNVLIGMLHIGDVPVEFFDSFLNLHKPKQWMWVNVNRSPTHHARNFIVNQILHVGLEKLEGKGAEDPEARQKMNEVTHFFFMDDDMTFPEDALLRLLEHDVPIVSGYYTKRFWPFWPVPMRRVGPEGYTSLTKYCRGLQEVDVVGGGCLLIKREVFEAIAYPWFEYVDPENRSKQMTEDVPFCEKAQKAGFPILLDFDVQCGHLITTAIGHQHWEKNLKQFGVDTAQDDPDRQKVMAAARDVRPYRPAKKNSRKKAS
jgi:hypothetical protein